MYEGNERRDLDDRDVRRGERSTTLSPALIAFVVIGILAVVFVLQNTDKARVNILFWDVEARIWVVIAVSIAIGVVLDRLFGMWWRRRRRD